MEVYEKHVQLELLILLRSVVERVALSVNWRNIVEVTAGKFTWQWQNRFKGVFILEIRYQICKKMK